MRVKEEIVKSNRNARFQYNISEKIILCDQAFFVFASSCVCSRFKRVNLYVSLGLREIEYH